jgi:hypothetical protein
VPKASSPVVFASRMDGFPISTAVVSARVAAFTTLAIEFAAKPQLEARKDRILTSHRTRRDASRRLLMPDSKLAYMGMELRSTVRPPSDALLSLWDDLSAAGWRVLSFGPTSTQQSASCSSISSAFVAESWEQRASSRRPDPAKE